MALDLKQINNDIQTYATNPTHHLLMGTKTGFRVVNKNYWHRFWAFFDFFGNYNLPKIILKISSLAVQITSTEDNKLAYNRFITSIEFKIIKYNKNHPNQKIKTILLRATFTEVNQISLRGEVYHYEKEKKVIESDDKETYYLYDHTPTRIAEIRFISSQIISGGKKGSSTFDPTTIRYYSTPTLFLNGIKVYFDVDYKESFHNEVPFSSGTFTKRVNLQKKSEDEISIVETNKKGSTIWLVNLKNKLTRPLTNESYYRAFEVEETPP